MDVSFIRSGRRRYAVRVRPAGHPPVLMDPAPGYDDLLPHDLVHFVVEDELGLRLGVFGQLAAGGTAGTFRPALEVGSTRERSRQRRRLRQRGEQLARRGEGDADLSERAAALCHHLWLARSDDGRQRRQAREGASYTRTLREAFSPAERDRLSVEALERICTRLDLLSDRWRRLDVGHALDLRWPEQVSR